MPDSDIIQNMRDHWNSLSTDEALEVPEWKITIYKQPMNMQQKGKLFKKMEADPIEGLVYVLIQLALDQKGNNLYTLENKQFLLTRTDPDLLSSIATWLMQTPSKKDIKKKQITTMTTIQQYNQLIILNYLFIKLWSSQLRSL